MPAEDAVDGRIKVGDVAIDLVERGKVQVVNKAAETVDEHEHREDYAISEYKGNQLLNVGREEPVWECVYLPSDPTTSVGRTYDFPDSRLARCPVEEAGSGLRRFQADLVVDVVEAIVEAADPDEGYQTGQLEGLLVRAVGEEIAEEAIELAEVDELLGGDGS